MYSVLMLLGFAMTFFISFGGSIFQIFGIYNNCHFRTLVSSWALPADQKVVQLTAQPKPLKTLENKHYADTITLAAVVVTAILCYFGWWYQNVMRRAAAVELGDCNGNASRMCICSDVISRKTILMQMDL